MEIRGYTLIYVVIRGYVIWLQEAPEAPGGPERFREAPEAPGGSGRIRKDPRVDAHQ